jgi:protein-tyrosine phosphatase
LPGIALFGDVRLSALGRSDILFSMVDIHCHILPGLDDGAKSLDEATEMAEMAIADGVTHVVATPHANSEFRFDYELIQKKRDELQPDWAIA